MNPTVEPIIDNEIAPEEAVTIIGGGAGWRFAYGKIVSGQELPGQKGVFEQERAKIVGRLLRVGIYEGLGKSDNNPYSQVEADIETADGEIHVKASLSDPDNPGALKPSVSAIKFAWGLLQFKLGEQLVITAQLSKEPVTLPNGRKGGHVTYVNFARLEKKIVRQNGQDAIKWIGTTLYSPKRAEGAPKLDLVEQWLELRPFIESHPAFGPRPASRTDDQDGAATTHLAALSQECAQKGWPTPEAEPARWLNLMAAYQQDPEHPGQHPVRGQLADYTDHEWGEIRADMQKLADCPKLLLETPDKPGAKEPTKKKNAAALGGEADPFKDQ